MQDGLDFQVPRSPHRSRKLIAVPGDLHQKPDSLGHAFLPARDARLLAPLQSSCIRQPDASVTNLTPAVRPVLITARSSVGASEGWLVRTGTSLLAAKHHPARSSNKLAVTASLER